jgi:hypothetical protein
MSFETTSNLLTLNNDPFPTTSTTSPTSTIGSDSKHVSKLILRSALQKANAAVQCDSTNDVLGAINAYKEAISLLERVLSTVEKENDRQRLQSIVSYHNNDNFITVEINGEDLYIYIYFSNMERRGRETRVTVRNRYISKLKGQILL